MYNQKRIIVIAPCYNEGEKILSVARRIFSLSEKLIDEFLVVDDGSSDGAPEKVERLGAKVIRLGQVQGVGAALRTGYDYAQQKGYDIIVTIAGNNKDEPKEIIDLIKPIATGEADFVQGARFLKKQSFSTMPVYRRIMTRVHPLLFSLCVGKSVCESTNGFRAFDIALLSDHRIRLNQSWLNQYELEPYLYYKSITLGYRTCEVPCTKTYPPKKLGQTKMIPVIGWWSILRPLFLLRLGFRS